MVETLSQLFLNTLRSYPKPDLMLHKKAGRYVPLSTQEFGDGVRSLSLGLRGLGHGPGKKLVLLSENCPLWVMTDLANLCLGGITVPLHTVLTPPQIRHIIHHSGASVVACSTRELWKKIEAVRPELEHVAHYILFESPAPEGVLTLAQIQEHGKRIATADPGLFDGMAAAVRPDDLASIVYTSGTTGVPKGAMLTHGNFTSNAVSCSSVIKVTDRDTGLSALPLSHSLERMVVFVYLYNGCTIAFAESLETLADNMLEVRPNLMAGAPRVFEKFYSRVLDNVLAGPALKKKIFFWAVKAGKAYGQKTLHRLPVSALLRTKKNIAHRLVFSKIIAKTGGRFRLFVSGAAPLSQDIAEFFYALGLVILEGYGLTETSPVISLNSFENLKFGTVGQPVPGVEVKIAEDGEILTRGPHVMKGYYLMEAETAEAFAGDWFRTGDVGHLDEDGFLVITDRKKDIIVTSGGKNVAPQQIENLLKTSPYISNAVAVGDRKKFISALIVPDFEKLEAYARAHKISFESRSGLLASPEISDFMMTEVEKSTANLASYERVKKIALLPREFELDQDEITPSLKVKRNIIERKYKDLIDSLYRESPDSSRIDPSPKSGRKSTGPEKP
jgi:long-chain acyl-CoA synthetase